MNSKMGRRLEKPIMGPSLSYLLTEQFSRDDETRSKLAINFIPAKEDVSRRH